MLVANNKKAYHDYEILEKFECGIMLTGTEIKSIRQGKISIKESYVKILKGEVVLLNANISPYAQGNIFNVDPVRTRKLLLHKTEINKLDDKIRIKGLTLVPLQVYLKGSLAKVEIGLAKGKNNYDKREALKEKDVARSNARENSANSYQ